MLVLLSSVVALSSLWHVSALLGLASIPSAQAALVNFTVDDAGADPLTGSVIQYQSLWKPGSESNPCSTCVEHPDGTRAFDKTWHEATLFNASFEGKQNPDSGFFFGFEGVAIYVYGIAPYSPPGTFNVVPDMYFGVDGHEVQQFNRPVAPTAADTNGYAYNVLLYANESLSVGYHIIQGYNGAYSGDKWVILLDYLVYTRDTTLQPTAVTTASRTLIPTANPSVVPSSVSASLSTHSNPVGVGAAVGITVGGGIVVTILIAAALHFWKKYRRSRLPPSAQYVEGLREEERRTGQGSLWAGEPGVTIQTRTSMGGNAAVTAPVASTSASAAAGPSNAQAPQAPVAGTSADAGAAAVAASTRKKSSARASSKGKRKSSAGAQPSVATDAAASTSGAAATDSSESPASPSGKADGAVVEPEVEADPSAERRVTFVEEADVTPEHSDKEERS